MMASTNVITILRSTAKETCGYPECLQPLLWCQLSECGVRLQVLLELATRGSEGPAVGRLGRYGERDVPQSHTVMPWLGSGKSLASTALINILCGLG
jgi:hypothetical protein